MQEVIELGFTKFSGSESPFVLYFGFLGFILYVGSVNREFIADDK